MEVSKFKNVKISNISEDLTPENIVSIDIDGNLKKSPVLNSYGRIIDGGAAETAYLAHQNVEGGSANSITNFRINGGNA